MKKEEKKDKLIIATSNRVEIIDENFIALVPERVILGNYIDQEKKLFHDYLSNENIIDMIDISVEGFECYKYVNFSSTLKQQKDYYKTKNTEEVLFKFFDTIKERVIIITKDNMYKIIARNEYDKHMKTIQEFEDDISIEEMPLLRISELITKVQEKIKGQDSKIKEIVTAIYSNYYFQDPQVKSNILLYGPSGCGKTEIIKTIGELVEIPVTIEDCTRYTVAGFQGSSIEDMLVNVYLNCDRDLEIAQTSILLLDEIDKKAQTKNSDTGSITKGDVLKSLLKLIEGSVYDLTITPEEKIRFDTTNLTVICSGAFSDLKEQTKTNAIGFNTKPKIVEKDEETIKSFIDYGMPIEFMGRMNTIVKINKLKKEDLIDILKNSTSSPMNIYVDRIKSSGIEINLDDELYEAIANKAIELKTGARSLKKIVLSMFKDILYEVFDDGDLEIGKIEITKTCVEEPNTYKLTKTKRGEL